MNKQEIKSFTKKPFFIYWLVLNFIGFVLILTPFYNYNVVFLCAGNILPVGYAWGYSDNETG
jgi:hypothetical protein